MLESDRFIARELLRIGAIKLQPHAPFTWASGIKSPIYCDNRMVLSHPALRRFVIEQFKVQAQAFAPVELVAGVATAGIAHGALLADVLDVPMVYVRSKPKDHGRENLIEGEIAGHPQTVVVEDLISTGGSVLQAVEALRQAGCKVSGVLAIFSYGFEAAQEAFSAADCPFLTLTNYAVLMEEAAALGVVQESDFETLRAWRQSPKTWGI